MPKRYFFLFIAVLLAPQSVAATSTKVQICHIPPSDPENAHTLWISERALQAHLYHGDLQGPCEENEGCPNGMARIEEFCIDRWEAHLLNQSPYEVPSEGVAASEGFVVPQGYISGEVAQAACQNAGKRLCTSAEWLRACQGVEGWTYPYGSDVRDPEACNDYRGIHPVIELFGTFTGADLNDPRLNQLPDGLDLTGKNQGCVTEEGVYDLVGNLHEWVADPSGIFRGGFYVEAWINGEGCLYRTSAHNIFHHDYSTGFRCCTDAIP